MIAIYIKDKPIIIVSRSFCGVYAVIIGFILMEERDIQLCARFCIHIKIIFVLKRNVKCTIAKI